MTRNVGTIVIGAIVAVATVAPVVAQDRAPIQPRGLSDVAPALEAYNADAVFGDEWNGAELSERDRALITVAALIARGQTGNLADYVELALDSGVEPAEISETITHLAFYAGWENAMAAVGPTSRVFRRRDVSRDELPSADPASDEMLPLDEEAESRRHSFVEGRFGSVSQGVVDNTAELLFRDLWLRPGLEPRDRSFVTVAALIAGGKVEQMPFHLSRAMDYGLTQEEASAALSHLAFYAGWPNVFSALPVASDVFERRNAQ